MIRRQSAIFPLTSTPIDDGKIFYPASRDPIQMATTESRKPRYQQRSGKMSENVSDQQIERDEPVSLTAPFETSEDIKTSLDKARKMYGINFGKLKLIRDDPTACILSEEEFKETGGLRGYVERGRSLYKRQKLRSAIMYLDFAIIHGRRELSSFSDCEPPDIILAREIKAKSLLGISEFKAAVYEADLILKQDRKNFEAMYVKGEGHYHQCHFERALMIYHQGSRFRMPIYGEAFEAGVHKATVVLNKTLNILNEPLFKSFLNFAAERKKFWRKSAHQVEFEVFVAKEFYTNKDLPPPLSEDVEKKKTLQIRQDDCAELFFDSGPTVAPMSASRPLAMFKNKINKKKAQDTQKKDLKLLGNTKKKAKPDKNMQRLKDDREFLDSIKSNVVTCLQKKIESQHVMKAKKTFRRLAQLQKDVASGPRKYGSRAERVIMDIADETMNYIDDRKTFWQAQKDNESLDEEKDKHLLLK